MNEYGCRTVVQGDDEWCFVSSSGSSGTYDDAWIFGLLSIPQSWLLARIHSTHRLWWASVSSQKFYRLQPIDERFQQCLKYTLQIFRVFGNLPDRSPALQSSHYWRKNGPTRPQYAEFSKNLLHVRLHHDDWPWHHDDDAAGSATELHRADSGTIHRICQLPPVSSQQV
jgi:hypothetical protein